MDTAYLQQAIGDRLTAGLALLTSYGVPETSVAAPLQDPLRFIGEYLLFQDATAATLASEAERSAMLRHWAEQFAQQLAEEQRRLQAQRDQQQAAVQERLDRRERDAADPAVASGPHAAAPSSEDEAPAADLPRDGDAAVSEAPADPAAAAAAAAAAPASAPSGAAAGEEVAAANGDEPDNGMASIPEGPEDEGEA
ncbi:hypothetical protein CXG81DRAFT_16699 [Caulochytrium protostelioides]|uniref:Uncharacterized protein n=1 Tax=Caulochytrium protostelioides TaxID=1555241 RepID=A0A4P9X093_9FUNG|nr:hypothetical protein CAUPRSCDRAFT_10323 [Caulochytrium protostelioides]RKP03867.1 hypothetical protein CXG81DRAFT_16699 [Caulochytrium protostelioides]|eukprot:RKP03867.1 hypothetical protein CXG81DRAFT_16699 [Caulochytrium protostelioides]